MVLTLSNGKSVGATVDIYEDEAGFAVITLDVARPGSPVWNTEHVIRIPAGDPLQRALDRVQVTGEDDVMDEYLGEEK